MAHFNTILLAAFSLLLTTALAKQPASDDDGGDNPAPAPSPSYDLSPAAEDLNYINSIPPAERKLLDDCSNRMTRKCGDNVVSGLLMKSEVSDDCCTQLVRMGKKCHNHLVKLLVRYPDFRQNAATIKESSRKIWSGCRDVAADPPASP
ncbi:hypothetical protein RHSIM_Rhsim01G0015900 [Rhododendron simsii]|uniref:Prolamin-like domain-containing protein n=1 Tax=Rhododendron simsii TaxID=118357 RepID=A0A834LZE3_RHOSS|nr:hypothetical protein RHSIM_Rhsim01G0015900 [Rhododendron simsii]